MTKHQLRLLLCAGVALALLVVAMFMMWFRISIQGMDIMGVTGFKLDLRSASACMPDGTCASVPLSKFQGFYPTFAVATFYASAILGVIVLIQAGSRLVTGSANESLTRLGYIVGVVGFIAAAGTGYLFQPETASGTVPSIGVVTVTVTRSWGPAVMLLADILALVALRFAISEESAFAASTTEAPRLPVTPVRGRTPTAQPYTPIRKSVLPFDSIPIDGPKIIQPRAPSSLPLDERSAEPPSPELPAVARTTSSVSLDTDDHDHVSIGLDQRLSANEASAPADPFASDPFATVGIDERMSMEPAADPVPPASRGPLGLGPRKSAAPPTVSRTSSIALDAAALEAAAGIRLDDRATASLFDASAEVSDTAPDAMPAVARTASSLDELELPMPASPSLMTLDERPSKPATVPPPAAAAPSAAPPAATPPPVASATSATPAPASRTITAPRTSPASPPRRTTPSTPLAAALTNPLLGKLSFATVRVSLSADGVDAACEDGARKSVAWTEIVGVVARRLPAEAPYDGATFVDLVSTSGSTLRFLPWTTLGGEPLFGSTENPVERARAFVQLVASRCPAAKLDGATRTFLGSRGMAAQLPDVATLAQHDERLS